MKKIKVILMNLVLFLGLVTTAGAVYQQSQAEEAYANSTSAVQAVSTATGTLTSDDYSSLSASDTPNTNGPAAVDVNGCGDCSACGAPCGLKQIR